MKRKKGFTLLEVMVTLLIFSILSLMISSILIQSQKILVRAYKSSEIQNEVRVALLKIQTEAGKYNEIIVNDKFGSFNGNKWNMIDGVSSAREILRFGNDEEDIAKVYVEINENNNHQLIEFNINKLTDEIIANSRNVLISNIKGNDVDEIKIYTEDILDSESRKISELITINCSSIINENIENETEYVITLTKENIINIDFGIENTNGGLENESSSDGNYTEEDKKDDDSNDTSIDESIISTWDSNKIYYKGDIVKYNNVIYKLAWDGNMGNNPEHGNAWTIISEEPTVWKRTKDYEGSQKVTHSGKTYISQWYANAGLEPGVEYVWKLID